MTNFINLIKKPPALYLLCALIFSACSSQENSQQASTTKTLPETKQLKIYNWSDYVDPQTIKDFEKQNKIKVFYDVYDSDETLEAKMLSGRSGYDIVAPSTAFVGRQVKAGAYQKLNKNLIDNYKNINPKLNELMQSVDPGNQYSVPYFWGVNTFAINEEKVKAIIGDKLPENQWDLVFNPQYTQKLQQCGISYLDSPSEMYPLALNYLHLPTDSNKKEDIKAAAELIEKNRPYIKRFSSSGYINDLARADICVAVGFGGDLNIAKNRAEEAGLKDHIRVLMPKEGVGIWVDSFAIPKDAENVRNAHLYINYILDAHVAARNGNFVTYAPSSLPAKELMEDEYKNNHSIFPSEEDLKNSFIMVPLNPDMLKIMTRQWQKIKSGK